MQSKGSRFALGAFLISAIAVLAWCKGFQRHGNNVTLKNGTEHTIHDVRIWDWHTGVFADISTIEPGKSVVATVNPKDTCSLLICYEYSGQRYRAECGGIDAGEQRVVVINPGGRSATTRYGKSLTLTKECELDNGPNDRKR